MLLDAVGRIPEERIGPVWLAPDVRRFSAGKTLWPYQQAALRNALMALWKYYGDGPAAYAPGEPPEADLLRKRAFAAWARGEGVTDGLDLVVGDEARLLRDHYTVANGKITFEQIANRMSFWMATGSGKTLVIVKLIEALRELMRAGAIPSYPILVLAHRDNLLDQFRAHVDEFNASSPDLFIRLEELRRYPEVARGYGSLLRDQELTVFYYRSDNLSDEQKEKIVDFRNYANMGRWYVLLDEAHKGDKNDSKRQHIYTILSRRGFLFNFSATFTDARDLATTIYDFNLKQFTVNGFGKHIAIMQQKVEAFTQGRDFTGDEKQRIVLQALILLACIRRRVDALRAGAGQEVYHRPLLLTLVNSVNKEDADLRLFFDEIERIGRGDVSDALWGAALDELVNEFADHPGLLFEEGQTAQLDAAEIRALTRGDLLRAVFNAPGPGAIEVSFRPSDRSQVALKLTSSDRHFGLIKTGEMPQWLRNELDRFTINERFEEEGFFETLNAPDADINMLMGSRTFYEGWDSNRPNVILFVNIGVGLEARKFVLQSVGRGVRIEPIKDGRQRLVRLHTAGRVSDALYATLRDRVQPPETLFIFGTRPEALRQALDHLNTERGQRSFRPLGLFDLNDEAIDDHLLLVPKYSDATERLTERQPPVRFEVHDDDLSQLKKYLNYVGDDRVLVARHLRDEVNLPALRWLRHSVRPENEETYYKPGDARPFRNTDLLIAHLARLYEARGEELDRLQRLTDEIRHYREIAVSVDLQDVAELEQAIRRVKEYPGKRRQIEAAIQELPEETRALVLEPILRDERATYISDGQKIAIAHLANHYYLPVIWSERERVDYLQHIVQNQSERDFLEGLVKYLAKSDNRFAAYDWWLFSKLDETLDAIRIPYVRQTTGPANFKPDFIFWLQRGDDYRILFVDPKGTSYTDYEHKVEGYKALFEDADGKPRVIPYCPDDDLNVRVHLQLVTDDVDRVRGAAYDRYWFESIDKMLAGLG